MVAALQIRDGRIRHALEQVPRHEFVPLSERREAYVDEPVPLGRPESTASAPHMVVLMALALETAEGQHLLEVGGGMGYLAAVLAELVGSTGTVDSLEVDPWLAKEAGRRLAATGYSDRVTVWCRDAILGLSERAPYDGIVVSCAVPRLFSVWKEQLKEGGRLVAPVGDRFEQRLVTFTRRGPEGTLKVGPPCRFVPLRSATSPHI